jgi:hypothetical protein
MAHAQKPNFVFRRNGRVNLNQRGGGASVQSPTGSRGVRISGSNAGYTMFRGSVKSTGYLPHSPVTPSHPLPCVTACHHISTGLYNIVLGFRRSLLQVSASSGQCSLFVEYELGCLRTPTNMATGRQIRPLCSLENVLRSWL